MHWLKKVLKGCINLYYQQRFLRAVRSGKLAGQLLVIMYHRVLPVGDSRQATEEPGMYVTPDSLTMHLAQLSQYVRFIHIEDWMALQQQGKLENTLYCALTFDDGWADNYAFALPILKQHRAPASIFLATDYINSHTTFWPERLMYLLTNYKQCAPPLKQFFARLNETLDENKLAQQDRNYFAHLVARTKALTDAEIKAQLSDIESALPMAKNREMLTWEELAEMCEAGVRIGGHTCSHMRLNARASAEEIQQEVAGCRQAIEQNLGLRPSQFCYPNGDTSAKAEEIVKAHFQVAVTTQAGINDASASAYQLKRVGLHEDASNTITKLLAKLGRALP